MFSVDEVIIIGSECDRMERDALKQRAMMALSPPEQHDLTGIQRDYLESLRAGDDPLGEEGDRDAIRRAIGQAPASRRKGRVVRVVSLGERRGRRPKGVPTKGEIAEIIAAKVASGDLLGRVPDRRISANTILRIRDVYRAGFVSRPENQNS